MLKLGLWRNLAGSDFGPWSSVLSMDVHRLHCTCIVFIDWTVSFSGCIFFNFLKSENLSTQKPSSPVGFQNRHEPDHPLSSACPPSLLLTLPLILLPTAPPPLCCSSAVLMLWTWRLKHINFYYLQNSEYRGHADNFQLQFNTRRFSLFPIP